MADIAVDEAQPINVALTDHLGTPRDFVEYDATNTETDHIGHRIYNSFGKLTSQTGTGSAIGFTGIYFEISFGLGHHRRRWYDPNAGRWVSEDPIGFAGGDFSVVRYSSNIPISRTDPFGLADGVISVILYDGSDKGSSLDVANGKIFKKAAELIAEKQTGMYLIDISDDPFKQLDKLVKERGKLKYLQILDHGWYEDEEKRDRREQQFGDKYLKPKDYARFKDYIAKGGVLYLAGCNIADKGKTYADEIKVVIGDDIELWVNEGEMLYNIHPTTLKPRRSGRYSCLTTVDVVFTHQSPGPHPRHRAMGVACSPRPN